MSEDNNVIEADFTQKEDKTALEQMLMSTPVEELSLTIAGVLEFLTLRALHDGPFYIETDDRMAISVLATGEDADALRSVMPENFKSWEQLDQDTEEEFTSHSDPGDEQDEPATES